MSILSDLLAIFGKKEDSRLPETVTSNTPQKKVIIVEDDDLLANALELKFKHENYNVVKASNGQIGLEMITANRPDVVLLDLMMPVMDGKTMLHKLRENPDFKFLPVVVLTNAGEVDNIRETKRYDNASAFLIKSSVNPEDIVKVVNDLA